MKQQNGTNCKNIFDLTRFVRLFSYGALSVVLVFYLTGLGLNTGKQEHF
jgi:hypothetical protein